LITLRPYQQIALDSLWSWMRKRAGNPCLVLPTGAGKSIITAEICRYAVQGWPGTRVLMLTTVKELIEQNAEKMRSLWPNVPLGIYSASIGKRQVDAVTFAGIQTVRDKAEELGFVSLVIVDECHLISHHDQGSYRKLIDALKAINPHLRVIGLTATPFRLGHGYITDGDAIFDDLLEPVSIPFLQASGYLAMLRSKDTRAHFDLDGVHKRGGEYIEKELQEAVDNDLKNEEVVKEIIARSGDRKAWLIFCTGVKHAHHIGELLLASGVPTETVTGATPKGEREAILARFRAGVTRAITNVSVLTTGFDYPDIDLIAFLRPTMSPGLYMQMAGRGLRKKSHTDHCLILDFAGLVAMHGPITAVKPPPTKGQEGGGVAPSKICPECDEIIPASSMICPACGYEFPKAEKKWKLHDDDIMGNDEEVAFDIPLRGWEWKIETSRNSGAKMVTVTYYPEKYSDPRPKEYFCVYHEGFVGAKAQRQMMELVKETGAQELDTDLLSKSAHPESVRVKKEGKWLRVLGRKWAEIPF
jgi:DNA repair protein RadD